MLAEDGKLSLDGRITRDLPGLPAAWSPVTVRHLLTTRPGSRAYTDVFGEKKVRTARSSPDEILALVKERRCSSPGEKFTYCNTGYYLLRMIIEEGVRQALRDVPRRTDLQAAGHDVDVARRLRRCTRPVRAGLQHGERADHHGRAHPPVAAVLGRRAGVNVVDLAKWDAALAAHASSSSRPATTRCGRRCASTTARRRPTRWAGRSIRSARGRGEAHGGGITGFSTFVPGSEDKVTVIVLTNQAGAPRGRWPTRSSSSTCRGQRQMRRSR